MDRSIAAAGRIIPGTDYRAKTSGIIGYEVETDDHERHYLNSKQIKPLKPKAFKVKPISEMLIITKDNKPVLAVAIQPKRSILTILRRS